MDGVEPHPQTGGVVAQQPVGTAAHQHAVALGGQRQNGLLLGGKEGVLGGLLLRGVVHLIGKVVEQGAGHALLLLVDELGGKARGARRQLDDLLVIELVVQAIGQQAANDAAAAAVLPANGNDQILFFLHDTFPPYCSSITVSKQMAPYGRMLMR